MDVNRDLRCLMDERLARYGSFVVPCEEYSPFVGGHTSNIDVPALLEYGIGDNKHNWKEIRQHFDFLACQGAFVVALGVATPYIHQYFGPYWQACRHLLNNCMAGLNQRFFDNEKENYT